MKTLLLSPILFFALAAADCHHPAFAAANVGGKWQLALSTPHGPMNGALDLKQDGDKLSGTCSTDHFGSVPLTGSVDGKKVTLSIDVQGMTFQMTGALDGDKMSGTIDPDIGSWTATRQPAGAAARVILGSVADILPDMLEFVIKPDSGAVARFRVGPETDVIQVPPGERDLEHGKPVRVTDIARGDRLLVSFVGGLSDARRIVLVSADDIAQRNEAERLDWQKRGISGTVVSKDAEEVIVETRTLKGAQKTTIIVPKAAKIRQYSPDSVSFSAAVPSTILALAPGDQFKARGKKTADGAGMIAEEIIFGTFLTKVGAIVAIDRDARRVRIEDILTKAPLTINLMPASQVKVMAATHDAASAHPARMTEPASINDLAQLLQRMPTGKVEDLKIGSVVVVTATKSSRPGEVTAIMLLANMDPFLQMARTQAASQGIGLAEAMAGMHGGLLGGSNGLALPAILP